MPQQELSKEQEEELKEQLRYDEEIIDATHTVECYEKGKTWECPNCGQGNGTDFSVRSWRCNTCGKLVVDMDTDEREPKTFLSGLDKKEEGDDDDRDQQDTKLTQWT